MNEQQDVATKNDDVIEEAGRLLVGKTISPHQAAYAEGEHVSALVAPRWNEDGKTFSVSVTFDAYDRAANWNRVPVFLNRLDAEGVFVPKWLNSRGQTFFRALPPGEYRASLSPVCGPSEVSLDINRPGPWEKHFVTKGGEARLTVGRQEEGDFVVSARTDNPRLAGALVQFSFVAPGAEDVRLSGTLTLEPRTERTNLWSGMRVYPTARAWTAAPAGQSELVFCVIPKAEKP